MGALLLALIPGGNLRAIRYGAGRRAAVGVAAAPRGSCSAARPAGCFQFAERCDWIPFFGIHYKLGMDGISLVLVVLTTTLTWISILASFTPIGAG